ncbi:hypothetical protein [Amycolatopsis thermoflava]|uniref:hypothetical protein n=1 Tax=Amycolatopsis thermoflava TaxID=84480 RepID=UPI003816AFFF
MKAARTGQSARRLLLTGLVRGTTRQVTGARAFAITGGLAVAAILKFWFGSLSGSFPANAGAIALTVAATALTILGLASLLGYAGFGPGAVAMMLVGDSLAGTATAPKVLPGWSGAPGQGLPPGAGRQLLRSTAFFDGRGVTYSVVVLVASLALGVVLCLAGSLRARRAAGPPTLPADRRLPYAPTQLD